MMKYVSVSQMQAIEREANDAGLTYAMMMENAGRGLAEVILEDYDFLEDRSVLGLVGSGNNGGDTLVALAYLAGEGWRASAALVGSRPENDSLVARLVDASGSVYDFNRMPDLKELDMLVESHGILLDGVLGTGIHLPLRGRLAEVIDRVRQTVLEGKNRPLTIAVDCPSGVDCDSGEAAAECIPATRTVTMAAVKQGLLKFPAYNLVGDLDVVEIGLPGGGEGLESWRSVQTFVPDDDWVSLALPPRPLDSHKGTYGTALIVAGSANFTGAALLAGRAAYRMGAGLVTLAVAEILHAPLAGHFPEATWLLLPHEEGFISEKASQTVLENVGRITAMLVGCGFGQRETTARFLGKLLEGKGLPPMVIDADGLKLLKQQAEWAKRLPAPAVLTPHPGEMSVLTDLPVSQIQSDRLETARKFSRTWGHVVVLKGAFTVIAEPEGRTAVIPVASPALAHAGTGDVLAGLITGLRAQGTPAFKAAVAGAWIHASAGLRAAEAMGGTASVLAGDVLHYSVEALAEMTK